MSKDYLNQDRTDMRRSDRGVADEAWIKALLKRAPVGYLATVHNDQPFINSNLFVYDETENAIYMHTAHVGRTQANVEQAPQVCFTVTEMGRLLPADVALEFSVEYASVVVFGTAVTIHDQAQATQALQMLLDKYAPHLTPGEDYRPPVPEELKRTGVFRIEIETWTGKKKEVAPDFPGAFIYDQV